MIGKRMRHRVGMTSRRLVNISARTRCTLKNGRPSASCWRHRHRFGHSARCLLCSSFRERSRFVGLDYPRNPTAVGSCGRQRHARLRRPTQRGVLGYTGLRHAGPRGKHRPHIPFDGEAVVRRLVRMVVIEPEARTCVVSVGSCSHFETVMSFAGPTGATEVAEVDDTGWLGLEHDASSRPVPTASAFATCTRLGARIPEGSGRDVRARRLVPPAHTGVDQHLDDALCPLVVGRAFRWRRVRRRACHYTRRACPIRPLRAG
jgi:hypothetical protein